MEIERSRDMNFITQNANMLHSIVIDLIRENKMTLYSDNILETFHSIIKNTNTKILTPTNIKEYNKFVMIEMKKRMRELQQIGPGMSDVSGSASTGHSGYSGNPEEPAPYLANDIREKRMQSIDDAFQKRQAEFTNGMTVKAPEPIDFSDDNKVEGSIDDLLTKTLQQREYVPEPVSQGNATLPVSQGSATLPVMSNATPENDIISGCFVPSMYTLERKNDHAIITFKQSPWQKLLFSAQNRPIVLEKIVFQDDIKDKMLLISSEMDNHGLFLKQDYSISLFDGYFVLEKKRETAKITLHTVLPEDVSPLFIFSRFSSSH